MKKLYLPSFVVMLLLLSKIGFTQDTVPSVGLEINFLALPATPEYKKIRHGQKFKVTISNINKSLFTIVDSTGQKDYNTEMPDIFKGIKLPGYLNLNVPPSNALPGGAAQGPSGITLNAINAAFDTIGMAKDAVLKAVRLNNTFKNLYGSCGKTYDSIKAELERTVIASFSNIDTSQGSQVAGLLSIGNTVQTGISAFGRLRQIIPLYINDINSAIKNNLTGNIWEWDNVPPKISDTSFVRKGKAASRLKLVTEDLKAGNEALKASLEKAQEIVVELQKFLDENKLNELVTNYNMINRNNFTYYSDEFKVKKDEVVVNIVITASKPLACSTPNKQTIEASYKTKGGWKVDFSTGLFGLAGNQDFLGRDLYYKPVDSATTMIKSKNGGNRILLGIGALMHIYWRTGNNINWAISPGLSTTTAFEGINFHLGGSLLTGGKNRIAITLGVVCREVKILDKDYELDKTYAKKNMPEAVPTIKVFPRFGGFVSITYNWSKLRK